MKKSVFMLFVLFIVSCSSPQGLNLNASATGSGEKISGTVYMSNQLDYAYPEVIEQSIKVECTQLLGKISQFTQEYSKAKGVKVKFKQAVKKSSKGNNLVVKVLNAVSKGNAFIGHQKFIQIQASLYKDGKLVDSVKIQRDSSGGFGGAFKGSCSVLGRCSKALGEDLALWLAKYYKK